MHRRDAGDDRLHRGEVEEMKIQCTKEEFAALVRNCYEKNQSGKKCKKCALFEICLKSESETPLEDMCEVEE